MQPSPFPTSTGLTSISFTGRSKNYTNADTWYPSWADDGHLYSPWTDGYILPGAVYERYDPSFPGYPCSSLDKPDRLAATAQARISGDDPLSLTITNLTPRIEAAPDPFGGRYPCGTLVRDGVWFYGTYCLDSSPAGLASGLPDWEVMGPFVGFRWSTDYGQTWTETPHTPESPIFGENPRVRPVRIGAPHFVDFGQNMQHSPDGMAYLVAHGSTRPEATNSWISGDQVYLLRVRPGLETMNDPASYEFYAGDGRWSASFADIQPLLEWQDHLGCVTITYNAPLGKYLMCVTDAQERGRYNALFLEANTLTGSWHQIAYLETFGPAAYFLNFPSKFVSADGRTLWLCYSANHHDKHHPGEPEGSAYSLSLHEVQLIGPTHP